MTVMDQPRFMTVETVAQTLAVSERVVYALLRSGELPAIQIGGRNIWRIETTKLEDYIVAQYASTRRRIADDDLRPDELEEN